MFSLAVNSGTVCRRFLPSKMVTCVMEEASLVPRPENGNEARRRPGDAPVRLMMILQCCKKAIATKWLSMCGTICLYM